MFVRRRSQGCHCACLYTLAAARGTRQWPDALNELRQRTARSAAQRPACGPTKISGAIEGSGVPISEGSGLPAPWLWLEEIEWRTVTMEKPGRSSRGQSATGAGRRDLARPGIYPVRARTQRPFLCSFSPFRRLRVPPPLSRRQARRLVLFTVPLHCITYALRLLDARSSPATEPLRLPVLCLRARAPSVPQAVPGELFLRCKARAKAQAQVAAAAATSTTAGCQARSRCIWSRGPRWRLWPWCVRLVRAPVTEERLCVIGCSTALLY